MLSEPVNGSPPIWSPDDRKLYAISGPMTTGIVDDIVVFDLVGNTPPVHIPANGYVGHTNWQRLAP